MMKTRRRWRRGREERRVGKRIWRWRRRRRSRRGRRRSRRRRRVLCYCTALSAALYRQKTGTT